MTATRQGPEGRRPWSGLSSAADAWIAELEREARYRRERYQLYLAKTHGRRPTSRDRLGKLKQASELAESRLRRARQAR